MLKLLFSEETAIQDCRSQILKPRFLWFQSRALPTKLCALALEVWSQERQLWHHVSRTESVRLPAHPQTHQIRNSGKGTQQLKFSRALQAALRQAPVEKRCFWQGSLMATRPRRLFHFVGQETSPDWQLALAGAGSGSPWVGSRPVGL